MADNKFNTYSDIDDLDIDEMLECYKRYLSSQKRKLTPEEYEKLRQIHNEEDESEILL